LELSRAELRAVVDGDGFRDGWREFFLDGEADEETTERMRNALPDGGARVHEFLTREPPPFRLVVICGKAAQFAHVVANTDTPPGRLVDINGKAHL
jgi:hypothetical protein